MCKSGFRKISNDSVLRYSILLVVLFFCASLHKMDAALASSSLEQVTIATVPTPASAPIFLAHDLEIFERHNLDVSMKLFETDFEALDTMMAGGCDFAATTGFMVAAKAFFTSEFRILATIAKADIYRIVALNSERIHKPADLSGATIGLKHMSIAQFYLEQFLVFHDVPPQEVTTREISLEKAPQALASNRIDAVLIFEPYLEDVLETLNQDTVIFPAQQEQDLFWVLLGSKGRVSQNPDIIRSFLVSLLEAEKFIRENTEEAEEMLAADLGLEDLSLKRYTFDLSLDQPLILTMENEARWIKKHLFKGREKIPNFLRYIHFESLQEINPQGVTIIH